MSDNLQRLRDAFPLLVWTALEYYYAGGGEAIERDDEEEEITGHVVVFVEHDLSRVYIRGTVAKSITEPLGPDPIAGLRAILEAEGARLGREADERTETARLLGWVPA